MLQQRTDEGSVSPRPRSSAVRRAGVASQRPGRIGRHDRAELAHRCDQIDPSSGTGGHRWHQHVRRCGVDRSSRVPDQVVHRHAGDRRQHAADTRPPRAPVAPVLVAHQTSTPTARRVQRASSTAARSVERFTGSAHDIPGIATRSPLHRAATGPPPRGPGRSRPRRHGRAGGPRTHGEAAARTRRSLPPSTPPRRASVTHRNEEMCRCPFKNEFATSSALPAANRPRRTCRQARRPLLTPRPPTSPSPKATNSSVRAATALATGLEN
jgi:hypothetical protein